MRTTQRDNDGQHFISWATETVEDLEHLGRYWYAQQNSRGRNDRQDSILSYDITCAYQVPVQLLDAHLRLVKTDHILRLLYNSFFFSISSEMELKWAENWRILLLFMFEMYCKDKNGEKNKQLFVNYSSLAECKFELYIDTNSFWKKRFFRNSLWEFVVHLGNVAFSIQENCCFPKWKLYTVDGEDNL